MKVKIAIAMDKNLVEQIDSKVDGTTIRSRSQAIEMFVKRGIGKEPVNTAVILLKGEHQKYALTKIDEQTLIKKQIQFLNRYGITKLYLITQKTEMISELYKEIINSPMQIEIVETEAKGNAEALYELKDKMKNSFVIMSGDVYNEFSLNQMIEKHMQTGTIATMGLMTRQQPSKYGSAELDGDYVVDFREKDTAATSNIVNAGIYIFKPEIFNLCDKKTKSIEKDLIPKLTQIRQLTGHFTHGKYMHLEE